MKRFQAQYQYLVLDRSILPICWSLTVDGNWCGVKRRADPEHIGRIDFYPKAFRSKEELVRTLFHERIHVLQFREFGGDYVQNNRMHFEDLAYDAEEKYIANAKERGRL